MRNYINYLLDNIFEVMLALAALVVFIVWSIGE